MAITWRNVNSPMAGFQVAGDLFRQAGQSINTGLGNFNTMLQDRQKLDEANRLNAQNNVVTDFRNYMSSLRNEGVDAVEGADHQATLQDIMARRGVTVAPRELDIAAEARATLTGARTDANTTRAYTQGEALAAADPVLQDYRARLLRDPNATLSEEQTNTLRSANLLDDAMEFQDSRMQTVDQRGRDAWRFDNEQKDALSKYARQDSERIMGQILAEEMAAGRASGQDDRTIMDNALRRASDPDSGVLPEHLAGFHTSTRGALDADFSPTAQEEQQVAIRNLYENLNHEQRVGGIQANLDSTQQQMSNLSPLVVGTEHPTKATITDTLKGTYDITDEGSGLLALTGMAAVSPLASLGLALKDSMTDDSSKNISEAVDLAEPLIEEFELENMSGAHIVRHAASMVATGDASQDGPQKLNMAQLKNLLNQAAQDLANQQIRYNKLTKDRKKYQSQLEDAQQRHLKQMEDIIRQRGNTEVRASSPDQFGFDGVLRPR